IDSVMGSGTARAIDPGAVQLTLPAAATDNPVGFLAAIDTIQVGVSSAARIVIDARTGVVVVGGAVGVGEAVVSLSGITLKVGGQADTSGVTLPDGLLAFQAGATAQDVAAGLRALGASPPDVVAVFDGLRAAGAVHAQVVIR